MIRSLGFFGCHEWFLICCASGFSASPSFFWVAQETAGKRNTFTDPIPAAPPDGNHHAGWMLFCSTACGPAIFSCPPSPNCLPLSPVKARDSAPLLALPAPRRPSAPLPCFFLAGVRCHARTRPVHQFGQQPEGHTKHSPLWPNRRSPGLGFGCSPIAGPRPARAFFVAIRMPAREADELVYRQKQTLRCWQTLAERAIPIHPCQQPCREKALPCVSEWGQGGTRSCSSNGKIGGREKFPPPARTTMPVPGAGKRWWVA